MASTVKLPATAAARRIVLEARDIPWGDGLLLDATWHVTSSTWRRSPRGTHSINALIVGRVITELSAFNQ
jgi:hypothetical protein